MSNLTTKQKIILGIVVTIMLIIIGIYGYITLNKEENAEEDLIENSIVDGNEEVNQALENEIEDSSNKENKNTEKSSQTPEQNTRKRKYDWK